MSELDPIEFYDFLKAHQRHIYAFSSLASLLPDNDDLSPLFRLLSDSLEQSMVPVMINGLKLSKAVAEHSTAADTCNR